MIKSILVTLHIWYVYILHLNYFGLFFTKYSYSIYILSILHNANYTSSQINFLQEMHSYS